MNEDKYSYCPICGRKTVYFVMRANGEDGYMCRMKNCDFEFFTQGDSRIDRDNEQKWIKANEHQSNPSTSATPN